MKTNIILTGFMATGKTTVGRRLARFLKKRFIDTDEEIERVTGMPIAQIFARHGERRFRSEEALALKRLAAVENCVIATGGGAVMHTAEIASLREKGWVVCLSAPAEVIQERVGRRKNRPLLARDGSIERIRRLLAEREPLYRAADFYLDTTGLKIDEITRRIINFTRQNGGTGIGDSYR